VRIKLLRDIPVHPDNGMTEGRVVEVETEIPEKLKKVPPCLVKWWVMGDIELLVGVHKDEAEIFYDA
jgi:hypothetical protein